MNKIRRWIQLCMKKRWLVNINYVDRIVRGQKCLHHRISSKIRCACSVNLHSRLNMRFYISKIVSTCCVTCATVDRYARQRLVSALVLSRIDYCNVVFTGQPSVTLALLCPNHKFSSAFRFVAGLGPRDHTSDAQRELCWLPIEQRILYKFCVIVHSVVAVTTPEYISDLATLVSELGGRIHLHSATHGMYDIPRTKTLIGAKAFSVDGPTAWNRHQYATFRQQPLLNAFWKLIF